MFNTDPARLCLILLLAVASAGAAATAENPVPERRQSQLEQLRQHAIVSGNFRQQRQLKGLPRALESSGRFVFWRQHGVYWETLKPFYQATTFTGDRTVQWASKDGPALEAGADDPVQRYVNKVMLALFSADLRALDKHFSAQWQNEGGNWSLELVPLQAGIARVIENIRLDGNQYLRRISVATRNGDRNTMWLEQITTPPSLSPFQCSRFGLDNEGACESQRVRE
jgi:hypothetical protein